MGLSDTLSYTTGQVSEIFFTCMPRIPMKYFERVSGYFENGFEMKHESQNSCGGFVSRAIDNSSSNVLK